MKKAKSRLPRRLAHNKNKVWVSGLGYRSRNYQARNLASFGRAFLATVSLTGLCFSYGSYMKPMEFLSGYGGYSNFQVQASAPAPTPTPAPEWLIGKITAYSCVGIKDKYHLEMNCPSLKYDPKGRTSDGTNPIPYKTMACDPANMGRTFEIRNVGRVKCTDTGGAVKGAGRFDLYVDSIDNAYKWGVKNLEYKLVLDTIK